MTSQVNSKVIWNSDSYSLIGLSDGRLIEPEDFDMTAAPMHTGCYDGYYSTYEIQKEKLSLIKFTISESKGFYKKINGIKPIINKLNATYEDLSEPVLFTGKMRIAKDFIDELYIHMGFQKASSFKTVFDLTFENGLLKNVKDRSKEMIEKQGQFKKYYESGDTKKVVYDAFQIDMEII